MLRAFFLSALLGSSIAHTNAQEAAPLDRRLTLSLGGDRFLDTGYEPTPRVEFAADLVRLDLARIDLGAALSWSRLGYSTGDPGLGCYDCSPGYDFAGHGLGGRLYAELAEAPLPMRFSIGLSRHVGRVKFSVADSRQFGVGDYTRRSTSVEFGFGLAWPLHRRFEVAADARLYGPLGTTLRSGPDLSLSVGLGIRL